MAQNCLVKCFIYNSIGWSVGAAKALREGHEIPRRLVVIVGDGALQTTVQELSTLLRICASNVIIFVLSNDGYSIERALHGAHREYNNIVPWCYSNILGAFGATPGQCISIVARNTNDLQDALTKAKHNTQTPISLLEILLMRNDYLRILAKLGEVSRQRNAYGYAPEYN